MFDGEYKHVLLDDTLWMFWWYHMLFQSSYTHISALIWNIHVVDAIFFLPSICVSDPKKLKKIYYFCFMGPRGHLEWCGATRLDAGAPEVSFSAKMTKMPLVNLGLTENQTRSKPSQNNTFHSFTSNPRFLATLTKFDRVWPGVDSRCAQETLILIWSLEWVETNVIANIIKFSVQWLFMGRNRSWTAEISWKLG